MGRRYIGKVKPEASVSSCALFLKQIHTDLERFASVKTSGRVLDKNSIFLLPGIFFVFRKGMQGGQAYVSPVRQECFIKD